MSLFNELKRRNVFRVAIAYVVMAWLVMQVADVVLNNVEAPRWIFHVLLLFLAIGLPFSIFFAWAFELTPEGLKREHEVDRTQSITHVTGRKLDFTIIGVLALALGYFAYDKFVLDTQRDSALVEATTQAVTEQVTADAANAVEAEDLANSIVVLPFVNMSSDPEQEYFSDGLSEELLNLLARIPDLRVISRSSAFSFKGQNIEIPEIARRLSVGHVLEGSVRKSGNTLRITAQLIDARNDAHLWSDTWDRPLDDVFAIQDEIAANVVEQLKVTLLGEAPHATEVNPEAYNLYLQARHMHRQTNTASLQQAAELYRQALGIEPDYAMAWSGLGKSYGSLAWRDVMPVEEALALSQQANQRALALDEHNAEAHSQLGWLAMYRDFDLAAAARHIQRALHLAPHDPSVLNTAGTLMSNLGRRVDSLAIRDHLVRSDPLNTIAWMNLGLRHLNAGHWEEAISMYQTALRLTPNVQSAWMVQGTALMFRGELQAAHEAILRESDEYWRLQGLAMSLHALGQHEDSDAALAELIEEYEQVAAYNIAYILAFRGETDRAFRWLDKALEYRDGGLAEIHSNPFFDPIRDDPRWGAFLERLNMSPSVMDSIEFDLPPVLAAEMKE